jgi:alcohol dehydrogenase class IV
LPAANPVIGVNQMIHTVENLNKAMLIPTSLHEAGVDLRLYESLEHEIVRAALEDATTGSNPRPVSESDVIHLLRKIV